MKHARATDANETEIVKFLEAHGCQVVRIGEPLDLLVCGSRNWLWILVELKSSDTHSLQRGQLEFLSMVKGFAGVATTAEEALQMALYPYSYTISKDEKDRLTQWLIRNPEQTKLSVRKFRAIIKGE